MAILKGPVRKEEYDNEWYEDDEANAEAGSSGGSGNPATEVIILDDFDAVPATEKSKFEQLEDLAKAAKEASSGRTLVSLTGDIEKVDLHEIPVLLAFPTYPFTFLVRKGGWVDCHARPEDKKIWRVQVVDV